MMGEQQADGGTADMDPMIPSLSLTKCTGMRPDWAVVNGRDIELDASRGRSCLWS